MVLFIDHHAVALGRIKGDGARAIGFGDFAADQLAFDQQLSINFRQRFQVDVVGRFPSTVGQTVHAGSHRAFDTQSIFVAAAPNKWKVGKVARKTDACTDHDVRFRAFATHPLTAVACQFIKVGVTFHDSDSDSVEVGAIGSSSALISSRSSEARS